MVKVYSNKHRLAFLLGCSIFIIICIVVVIFHFKGAVGNVVFYIAVGLGSVFLLMFLSALFISNRTFNDLMQIPDSAVDGEQGQPEEGYWT